MTDPRFITEGDRDEWAAYHTNDTMTCMLLDHAAYMDERDARQRDLIRRLAEALDTEMTSAYNAQGDEMRQLEALVLEAEKYE